MKFHGIRNFRDLHDLETHSQNRIPPRQILRCGDLSKATKKDLAILHDVYRVKLIIDLRATKESLEEPDRLPEGAEYRSMPVFEFFGGTDKPITKKEMIENNAAMPTMLEMYTDFREDPNQYAVFEKAAALIDGFDFSTGSVLFHCKTGKDRTGCLAAYLEKERGYSREEIYADYLASNETYRKDGKKIYSLVLLWKRDKKLAARARDFFIMPVENIKAFLGEEK